MSCFAAGIFEFSAPNDKLYCIKGSFEVMNNLYEILSQLLNFSLVVLE